MAQGWSGDYPGDGRQAPVSLSSEQRLGGRAWGIDVDPALTLSIETLEQGRACHPIEQGSRYERTQRCRQRLAPVRGQDLLGDRSHERAGTTKDRRASREQRLLGFHHDPRHLAGGYA